MIVGLIPEAEFLKLVIQGGATAVAGGLMLLLFYVIQRLFKSDEQQDKRDERWMQMLEKALDSQHTKYAGLVDKFEEAIKKTQGELIAQMIAHMAEVTTDRNNRLDRIDANVKTIPAETVRLLTPTLVDDEPHGVLVEGARAGLEPLINELRQTISDGFDRVSNAIIARIEAQGEALTPSMRTMLKQEFDNYQQRSISQIDNLARMVETLRVQLENRQESTESIPERTDTQGMDAPKPEETTEVN